MTETEQAVFVKIIEGGNGRECLLADNAKAAQFINRIEEYERVIMTPRRPRNINQHRLYWALLNKIAENSDAYTADDLHIIMKRRIGHCKVVNTKKGPEVIELPTDFAAMPQDAFQDYFERVKTVVLNEIWPHLSARELQAEIDEMIGERR